MHDSNALQINLQVYLYYGLFLFHVKRYFVSRETLKLILNKKENKFINSKY